MRKTLLSIACLLGSLFSNAQSGAALNFDGSDDNVAISSTSLLSMTTAVTIETWVKTGSSSEEYIITKSDDSYYMGINVDGNVGRASFYISGVSTGWLYSNVSTINDNNWHHIASTYDGTMLKIYIDGVLDNSVAGSGSIATGISNVNLGCRSNNYFLQGSLDELRIWDVARTNCEIISYKYCEIPSTSTGLVANYHFNQGIDAGNNLGITALTDDSGNSNTGTLGNFFLFAGSSSNWIAPGGVTSGNITPSACTLASALNFDGSDDQIALGPINISGNSSRTVEFWIKTSNTGNFQNPFSSGNANTAEAFNIKVTPSGHLGFMAFFNDYYPSSGTIIADNTFHHVAITYDGTTVTAYIDGNHEWDFAVSLNTTGENNFIGQSNHINNEQYFGGTLDELRIWNVARTRCELVSYKNCEIPTTAPGLTANYHFNQGVDMMSNPLITTLTDASGNAIDGTLSDFALSGSSSNWVSPGAVVSGFSTPITCTLASALNFDGYDDRIDLGTSIAAIIDPLNTITVEAWVNPSTTSGLGVIIGNYATGTDDMQFLLRRDFDEYAFWVSAGAGFQVVSSGLLTVLPGTWQHVAGVWNGSELKIYIDGVLKATTTGVTGSSFDNIPQSIIIGYNNRNENFSGSIDEIRLWTTARSQCEINTYKDCEIPGASTGLLVNYHFNHGLNSYSNPGETTVSDFSGNGNNGPLSYFSLNGITSNWVAPGGVVNSYTTALAPPVITVNSGAVCAGQSFTMVPGGALTYTYSGGTDVTMPTSDATYTVTGTDATGCENTAISSVTVNALPTMMAMTSNSLLCTGETATLSVTGSATSYTWSTTETTTDIVVSPTAQTTYTVDGTDANGCSNTTTITQDVSLCTGIAMVASGASATINVYPNPTNGLFIVEVTSVSKVTVTNALGEVVLSETLEAGKHPLTIRDHATGIYFVKAIQDNKQEVIKIIKE